MGAGRAAIPILWTALAVSGCAGWRSYQPSDPAAPLPRVLRLSLQGDSIVILEDAVLEGDSVYVGMDGELPHATLRIPVHRVEGVEVPRDSDAVEVISGAVGLVLGGALLVWLFGLLGA
jgi:hypothetical protein